MPDQNPVVRITVGEDTHILDFSDLNAIDAKDFRREVGIPLAAVLSDKEDADIDIVAGLVWLARRKNEPRLTFAEVAGSITLTTTMDLASEGEQAPEA